MSRHLTRLTAALTLIALAAPLHAQRAGELSKRTHRNVDPHKIVEHIAAQIESWKPRANGQEPRLVWLFEGTDYSNSERVAIADALEAKFKHEWIRHRVFTATDDVKEGSAQTLSTAELIKLLRSTKLAEYGKPVNMIKAIAQVADRVDRNRKVGIVAFCPTNADTEFGLEAAVGALKRRKIPLFAIAREAFFSDPFWFSRPGNARVHGFAVRGAECPQLEYPWGFWTQRYDPHYQLPSGWGIYAYNRLVVTSGGHYYIYAPGGVPSPGRGWCDLVNCRVYASIANRMPWHDTRLGRPGDTVYNTELLPRYEPSTLSRSDYTQKVARHRVWWAVRQAWEALRSRKALRGHPEALDLAERLDYPSLPGWAWNWHWVGLYGHNARFEEDRAELIRWARALERFPRNERAADPLDWRANATAGCLALALRVEAFNLGQLNRYAAWARNVFDGKYDDILVRPWGDWAADNVNLRIERDHYTFCFGSWPIHQRHWLGGKVADAEMKPITKLYDELVEKYRYTPYELLARRLMINRYRLWLWAGSGRRPRPGPKRPAGLRPPRGGGGSKTGGGAQTR